MFVCAREERTEVPSQHSKPPLPPTRTNQAAIRGSGSGEDIGKLSGERQAFAHLSLNELGNEPACLLCTRARDHNRLCLHHLADVAVVQLLRLMPVSELGLSSL